MRWGADLKGSAMIFMRFSHSMLLSGFILLIGIIRKRSAGIITTLYSEFNKFLDFHAFSGFFWGICRNVF